MTLPLLATVIAAGLLGVSLSARAENPAPEETTGTTETTARPLAAVAVTPEPEPAVPRRTKIGGAALEVLQMHKTGVSEEVLQAYVQAPGRAFHLQARDIIELTQAGVPASLIVAMIQKGSPASVPSTIPAPAPGTATATAPEPGVPATLATAPSTPAVSTEPIFVTVARKKEYVPFVPPWVTGVGNYPYSYYPSARERAWQYWVEDEDDPYWRLHHRRFVHWVGPCAD